MSLMIALLREAADIISEPAGRHPEDTAAVAARLVEFADRAESWGIADVLGVEAEPIVPVREPHTRRDASDLFKQYEEQARKHHAACRILAEFLRLSGFDNPTREETSR